MGVTGLWRLIEPAGKPVPIETLENKVLAVDISIWLHQVVKGYQDAKGAPLPNAHLMGLFQRLCKLLYFRIKPVFVFDGGFPELKRETIAKRQDNKTKYNSESERLKREIALLLGKKSAIGALLGSQISPKKTKNTQSSAESDDIFRLPALPQKEEESESESDDEQNSSASTIDLHSVDIESEDFKNMPVKEKYDLLVELKETRKMNSWGKLHTLPKKSDNFSDFQMQRLLKRRKVQECLQETEKEMGDVGMSLNDLESLLNEEGIETKIENLPTRRIASNNTTRYLLINNVQQALADAKKREEAKSSHIKEKDDIDIKDESEDELQKAIQMSLECEGKSSETDSETFRNKKDELEEDLDKAIKMSLECVEEPNTSASKTDDSWTSYKSDSDYSDIASDSEDGDGYEQPDFSTAKAYIMQYSDLTHNAINDIVSSEVTGNKNKRKCQEVDKIIEELNHERSIIADKVNLCSDEDEDKPNIIYPNETEQLKPKPHVNNRDILKEIESSMESEDKTQDHIVDMDTTQSSVLYIDKPSDEVVILDTSSEEILERRPGLTATNIVPSANNSDSSDDEFEEVPETVGPLKPIVQVTLNVTDTIEDDIFADVFETKGPVVNKDRETHYDRNQIETNIMADRVKPIDIDPKQDANIKSKSGENQEPCGNEKINPEIKCNKENIKTKHNANSQSKVRQKQVQEVIMKPESMCDKVNIDNILPKSNPCLSESSIDLDNVCLTSQATVNKESCPPEKAVKNVISTDKLHSMVSEIENEEKNLQQEKGRMERIGRNITEQMTKEAQELLQIFGIPYIVAPMEAEAQCAFLESVNLTDGTITDDSDIWLFGGKTVYKNFFNQKKHVLQFLSERIEKSYNLSREQLILLALLVGSDYTTGVSGVGPVTALEILAAFPLNKRQLLKETAKHGQYQHIVTGLQEFQKWVLAGRRTDNINLKKKLRNVTLSDDFPSVRVVQAYMDPNVEKSKEKFTWGQLDITILRDYAKAKFGWSQNKLDVILQPVIKRMLERKTQKTVQDYFKRKINFESLEDQMSKRVKAAVQKMVPETENGDFILSVHQNPTQQDAKVSKKRKGTKQDGVASTSSSVSKEKKSKMVKNDKVSFTTNNGIEINIPKTDRYQELIPQREKDMQNNLQAKLKAIEIFRKTKIDRKRKPVKKKVNLPKDKAELSETSDSD